VPAFQLIDWLTASAPPALQVVNAAWRSPVILVSLVTLPLCRSDGHDCALTAMLRLLALSIMIMMFGMFAAHWLHPEGEPVRMVQGLIMSTFVVSLLALKGSRELLALYTAPFGVTLAWLGWRGADFNALLPVLADSGMMLVIAMVASELLFRLRLRSRQLEGRLRRLAATDELTGLQNRREVQLRIDEEMSRSRRHHQALSVLVGDLDHFKRVNDTHGHDAGDEVLRAIGRRLRRNLREEDLAVRWGGEEFLLVLPSTTAEEAARVAEKLRELIGQTPIHCAGGPVAVTISFGVAAFAGETTVRELIKRADDALYRAKRTGRNRVCLARGPETGEA